MSFTNYPLTIERQYFPSTMQQQSNILAGNGGDAQNVTSIKNWNDVHEKGHIALDHYEANPTELNQNLGTNPNTSSTNPQPENEENNEMEQRKSLTKRKSTKKYRKKRKLQDILATTEMMPENGGGVQNVTIENCSVVHEDINTESDHFEANPIEFNHNLSTNPSAFDTNPQLENEEERQTMIDFLDSLNVENAMLKKELLDFTDKYVKLKEENNSIMEELNEEYGKGTLQW